MHSMETAINTTEALAEGPASEDDLRALYRLVFSLLESQDSVICLQNCELGKLDTGGRRFLQISQSDHQIYMQNHGFLAGDIGASGINSVRTWIINSNGQFLGGELTYTNYAYGDCAQDSCFGGGTRHGTSPIKTPPSASLIQTLTNALREMETAYRLAAAKCKASEALVSIEKAEATPTPYGVMKRIRAAMSMAKRILGI